MSVAGNLSEKGNFSRSFSAADSVASGSNYSNTGNGRMTANNALKENTNSRAKKAAGAFRTISEVAEELGVQQHVLRFWETKFTQVRPLKRGGGRRYYRPEDIEILRKIYDMLYNQGYTIKGVQRILKGYGKQQIASFTGNELSANTEATSEKNTSESAPIKSDVGNTQDNLLTTASSMSSRIEQPAEILAETPVTDTKSVAEEELKKIEKQYKDNLRLLLGELYDIRKIISEASTRT